MVSGDLDLHPPRVLDELEMHAATARKLLANNEWTPTRLLWTRLTSHLEKAVEELKRMTDENAR